MNIFVVNCGSSSLKYQLIDSVTEKVIAKGLCERIGIDGFVSHRTCNDQLFKSSMKIKSHIDAFHIIAAMLIDKKYGIIENLDEIDAIGHRVVQGTDKFKEPIIITNDVLKEIHLLSPLAPLHNPAHVQAIEASEETFDNSIPQVAVFDTSFHQTIPQKAYMYGLPYETYEKYGIRKYGFHGISHKYVSTRFAELTNRPLQSLKLVSCHLGNGSSICAIDQGKSVETTMGLTPLEGLIMGTRSGDFNGKNGLQPSRNV